MKNLIFTILFLSFSIPASAQYVQDRIQEKKAESMLNNVFGAGKSNVTVQGQYDERIIQERRKSYHPVLIENKPAKLFENKVIETKNGFRKTRTRATYVHSSTESLIIHQAPRQINRSVSVQYQPTKENHLEKKHVKRMLSSALNLNERTGDILHVSEVNFWSPESSVVKEKSYFLLLIASGLICLLAGVFLGVIINKKRQKPTTIPLIDYGTYQPVLSAED